MGRSSIHRGTHRRGGDSLRYLGYVPEADLPGLFRAAKFFVYPSLYEGFGLPPAQALAAGIPVLTSAVSSLPEVCGQGAIYVDPQSETELSHAFRRLIADASLRTQFGGGRTRSRRSFYMAKRRHKKPSLL